MENIIKNINYYILKIEGSGRKYYKIGEGTLNRPNQLVEKYMHLRAITASEIYTDNLPHTLEKRLNDKTIHKNLVNLIPVDHFVIKGLLNEDDGSNEFFQAPSYWDDNDVINYVKDVVNDLSMNSSNFKVKNKFIDNIKLIYPDKQKHQVNYSLIKCLLKDIQLNKLNDKSILIVGQFIPDWIATFALNNKVYIWHDSADERYTYKYDDLNDCIIYI